MKDYREVNRINWNERVEVHYHSDFYDVQAFLQGKNSLDPIVLGLLGDVRNLSVLHLQCHFGQDTLSLARLGAKVTGADLSDKAIAKARELGQITGLESDFICCDLYDLPSHIHTTFDVVFTSYGTIGWLPDLDKWAEIIARFLHKSGRFVMADFHPFVWMWDNNFGHIAYDYFNTGAILEPTTGSYTDGSGHLQGECIFWNHSISEIINALINNGLRIDQFMEYPYSPYNCFRNTKELEKDKFIIEKLGNQAPLVYSILAGKDS